ncbi:Multidrug resistance-associated protein 1 [Thoreauomyces humboldtii]|nr:Multidrug resistance-associated protein 1 [Thoreauomyces humboldtii]
MASFKCQHPAGWGPANSLQAYDLAPCFEALIFPLIPTTLLFLVTVAGLLFKKTSRNTARGTGLLIVKLTVQIAASVVFIFAWIDVASQHIPSGFAVVGYAIGGALTVTLTASQFLLQGRPSSSASGYYIAQAFLQAAALRTMSGTAPMVTFALGITLALVAVALEEVPVSFTPAGPGESNEGRSGLISTSLFSWVFPLLRLGYSRTLVSDDLYAANAEIRVENTSKLFEEAWTKEKSRQTPVLTHAILLAYKRYYVRPVCFATIGIILSYTQPMILDSLLAFIDTYQEGNAAAPLPFQDGLILSLGMLFAGIFSSIFTTWSDQAMKVTCYKIRSGLASAMFEKALVLSPTARATYGVGEISNRMTADADEVLTFLSDLQTIWTIFLQVVFATFILYRQLSWPIFVGIAIIIASGPPQGYFTKKIGYWTRKKKKAMDARLRATNEVLGAAKAVKVNALESTFYEKITKLRDIELKPLATRAKGRLALVILSVSLPLVAYLAILVVYSLVPGLPPLDAQRVFVSLTAFQLIRNPLIAFPQTLSYLASEVVSINRIGEFLMADEAPVNVLRSAGSADASSANSVQISKASFGWSIEASPTLMDVELSLARGSLTALLGPSGAGKTSLLAAILGEMEVSACATTTPVHVAGTVAYVSQEAFIMNGTLRDNVLFGSPIDEAWYAKVLKATALVDDIDSLGPDGDRTVLGDRGAGLSGGQRARVSLARAVYARAEVYLLDDCLAALDNVVQKHVFEQVISGPSALLAGKTRLMVTHSEGWAGMCDHVLVMAAGRLSEREAVSRTESVVSDVVDAASIVEATVEAQPSTQVKTAGSPPGQPIKKKGSPAGAPSPTKKSVSPRTYFRYFTASGMSYFLFFVVATIVNSGLTLGTRYWLQYWTEDASSFGGANHPTGYYLGVYSALIFVGIFFTCLPAYLWMGVCAVRASKRIHNGLLRTILRQPMAFYDSNPVGTIANRFTEDCQKMDLSAPVTIMSTVNVVLRITVNIMPAIINTPVVLVALVPAGLIFFLLSQYYLASKNVLTRIGAMRRAPIMSNLSETLDGLFTIRASDQQRLFKSTNARNVDLHQAGQYINNSAAQWFSLWVQMVGALLFFVISALSCSYASRLNPASVGLAISSLVTLTSDLTALVGQMVAMMTDMTYVERLLEYSDLPQEPDANRDGDPSPDVWPSAGNVEFENYSVSYKDGGARALDGLDLKVASGEKIGIVGRTGAGKSTIAGALLRLIEGERPHVVFDTASTSNLVISDPENLETPVSTTVNMDNSEPGSTGRIVIDGIDISTLGLDTLRRGIATVQQEAVLFSGTLRFNLDFTSTRTDTALWSALETTTLRSFVDGLEGKLDFLVESGGKNLSAGQRQLICVARALLSDRKIVIMDEATASLDLASDEAVRDAVRRGFPDATVLTIAHRLDTVADSDRILVLDRGRVAELGRPEELVKIPGGLYRNLLATGGGE